MANEDFRDRAMRCIEAANSAHDNQVRQVLFDIAANWMTVAIAAERTPRPAARTGTSTRRGSSDPAAPARPGQAGAGD